jgi:hypothetical protein
MKKFIFAIPLIVLSLFLFNCTYAGAELSLMGNWVVTSSPYDSSLVSSSGSMQLSNSDTFAISVGWATFLLPNVVTETSCSGKITSANAGTKKITLSADTTNLLDMTGTWDYVLSASGLTLTSSGKTYTFRR